MVLRRRNNTVQVGADVDKRRKQASSAYFVKDSLNTKMEYLLIDDVWTTGSSMMAACREMREAGAKNMSVVLVARSG